jgi:hypothetical protein
MATPRTDDALFSGFAGDPSERFIEFARELEEENNKLREALERIAKWFDEFPPSNRFYDDGEEMSYGCAFGSNGERDYMRGIAKAALGETNAK